MKNSLEYVLENLIHEFENLKFTVWTLDYNTQTQNFQNSFINIKLITLFIGFNFSEVISSVQKHRPSRCFATYELLNKKYLKSKSQPKTVSLKEVRREMERSKNAVAIGNSESDSGFENKSSSSETELNKNGKSGQSAQTGYQASTLPRATMTQTPTQNAHATTKLTNLTRHNSQTLPTKPNVNKPLR